jgi:proline racemase
MFTCIDAHVAGTVVRLVTAGLPSASGRTPVDRARTLERRHAPILNALTREPRGHDGVTLAIFDRPAGEADAALLFRTAHGFVPVSGLGLLGATAIALDRAILVPRRPDVIRIETVDGVFDVRRTDAAGSVSPGTFSWSLPSAFVLAGGVPVAIGARTIRVDIAWGGQFVVIVDAEGAGLPMASGGLGQFRRVAQAIAAAVTAAVTLAHPLRPTVDALGAVIFTGPPADAGAHLRILPVSVQGTASRGPSAEGVAAISAVLDAMGIAGDGPITVEGVVGTSIEALIVARHDVGGIGGVDVEIRARPWIIAEHRFVVEEGDPLGAGYEW